MKWNVFRSLVSTTRRLLFLTRYMEFNYNSSGTNIHYTGGAMGAMGAMAGQSIGTTVGCARSAANQMPHNFLRNIAKYSVIISLIYLFLTNMPSTIQRLSLIFASFVYLLLVASLIIGLHLGDKDYKKYKKIIELEKKGSPQDADELLSHLSDHHIENRQAALRAIHSICKDSPGRLLKHTTHSRESLASTLVGNLSETNESILETSSSTIKWLARDHGEMFVSHSKTIAQNIESPHAAVQTNITIALGNIAQFDREHNSAYAKALVPAAKDLDSEVRNAAAATLGKIPCSESITILEYLVDNETAPDVTQEAKKSLEQLRTPTAT